MDHADNRNAGTEQRFHGVQLWHFVDVDKVRLEIPESVLHRFKRGFFSQGKGAREDLEPL